MTHFSRNDAFCENFGLCPSIAEGTAFRRKPTRPGAPAGASPSGVASKGDTPTPLQAHARTKFTGEGILDG